MSETEGLPDLAGQVRPLIQMLPVAVQPRLMATLERAAADRYRAWAVPCSEPAQGEACAHAQPEKKKSRHALRWRSRHHLTSSTTSAAFCPRLPKHTARLWPSGRPRRSTRFRPRLNVGEQPSGAPLRPQCLMRLSVKRFLRAPSSKSAAPSFSKQS